LIALSLVFLVAFLAPREASLASHCTLVCNSAVGTLLVALVCKKVLKRRSLIARKALRSFIDASTARRGARHALAFYTHKLWRARGETRGLIKIRSQTIPFAASARLGVCRTSFAGRATRRADCL
jgi:hypothetical protein